MTLFRPALCHPERPHHARGLCDACYFTTRWRALHPRPAPAALDGPAFAALRQAHGWNRRQVCSALYYSRNVLYHWEHGYRPIPPAAAAWLLAFGSVPASGAYPPTRGGFRLWLMRHPMTCREFADFCGASERAVAYWLDGRSPIPLPLRAWLRAGAPHDWLWAPPPLPNRIGLPGSPVDRRAWLRPAPTKRHPRPRILYRTVISRSRKEA